MENKKELLMVSSLKWQEDKSNYCYSDAEWCYILAGAAIKLTNMMKKANK